MNVQDLIKAHTLYARWQTSSLEADFDNACSMAFLSMAPAASLAELHARQQAVEEIRRRQAKRMQAAEAGLLTQGADAAALTEFRQLVSEAAASAMLKFTLDNLIARQEEAGSVLPHHRD